ncbi:MAG TPA: hypothetical protein VN519_12075 [Bryobacteraceae bacterium]|nr:hypothetical protein [Bryobacteraceae bacterium]
MTTKSTEGTGAGSVSSGRTTAGGAPAAKAATVKASTVSTSGAKAAPAKPRPAKKPKASQLTPCNKCGGEIFRSSFRNFGEVMLSPVLLPFRCSRCGWRQFRSSFSRVRDKSNYRRATTDQ